MSNQLAEALRRLVDASMVAMTDQELATGETLSAWEDANEALTAHEAAKERTGWPAAGRLAQDDSRELSKWLSNAPGARRLVDEAAKPDPVAFVPADDLAPFLTYGGSFLANDHPRDDSDVPLYAAPVAAASPLSDEQLLAALGSVTHEVPARLPVGWKNFARAIEQAHGIKEKP